MRVLWRREEAFNLNKALTHRLWFPWERPPSLSHRHWNRPAQLPNSLLEKGQFSWVATILIHPRSEVALLLWDLRKGSSFSAAMSPSPPTRHRDPHTLLARGAGDCGPGARRSKFKSHHSGHDLGPGSGLKLVTPCTLCTCWVLGTREADSYLLTQVREARRAQSPGSRVSPRGGLYVCHSPEPNQGGSCDQRSPRPLSVQHLPGDITQGAEYQVQPWAQEGAG